MSSWSKSEYLWNGPGQQWCEKWSEEIQTQTDNIVLGIQDSPIYRINDSYPIWTEKAKTLLDLLWQKQTKNIKF